MVEEGERRPVNQTKPTWLVLPRGGVLRVEKLTKKFVMTACTVVEVAKRGQKETKYEPNQTNMAAVCLVVETKSESPAQ